jgi:hypothetical protein
LLLLQFCIRARHHGMSKDWVDIRGRWKNKDGSQASDRYADPEMQALDAQVAAVLCCGGPIRYKLHPEMASSISDEWLHRHVVPGMAQAYGDGNAVHDVLALPLLYACFAETTKGWVPASIREPILAAYREIDILPDGTNPVVRVPLNIYAVADQLFIKDQAEDFAMVPERPRVHDVDSDVEDDFEDEDSDEDEGAAVVVTQNTRRRAQSPRRLPLQPRTAPPPRQPAPASSSNVPSFQYGATNSMGMHGREMQKLTQMMNGLLSRQDQLRMQVIAFHQESQTSIAAQRHEMHDKFTILNKNVDRVAVQPARQVQQHAARYKCCC